MATATAQQERFERSLEAEGLKFTHERDGVTSLCFGGGDFSYPHLKKFVIFDEDGGSARLLASRFAQIPEGRHDAAVRMCNAFNSRFRWVRFYIDEDGELTCDVDAVITDESCPEACTELVYRMASIVDTAYPEIMKTIWA